MQYQYPQIYSANLCVLLAVSSSTSSSFLLPTFSCLSLRIFPFFVSIGCCHLFPYHHMQYEKCVFNLTLFHNVHSFHIHNLITRVTIDNTDGIEQIYDTRLECYILFLLYDMFCRHNNARFIKMVALMLHVTHKSNESPVLLVTLHYIEEQPTITGKISV